MPEAPKPATTTHPRRPAAESAGTLSHATTGATTTGPVDGTVSSTRATRADAKPSREPGRAGDPARAVALTGHERRRPRRAGQRSRSAHALLGLLGYLRPHRWNVLASVLMALGGSVLTLIGPGRLSEITDLITAGLASRVDLDAVRRQVVLLAALYAGGFALTYAQGFLMAGAVQSVIRSVRSDIARKINRLPLSYLDSRSTGDVLSRVTNDVDTMGQSMNQSLSSLVASGTLFLGSGIMMLVTNWIMGLAGISTALLGMAVMARLAGRSQHYFSRQQEQIGALNGHIEETYGGFAVVKAFSGEERARRILAERNDALYDSAWRSQFLSGLMMPLMMFIGNLAYVVVCLVGAALALHGAITFGTIVAFMVYIRLFTQPLQTLAQTVNGLQPMVAAARRVFALLEETELGPEAGVGDTAAASSGASSAAGTGSAGVRGEVEISHLSFGYVPGHPVLTDFSTRVAPGQKVAIVGPTGAGKTTIVNLLMRFYEADSGTIRIDGRDITAMPRSELREMFGMVLQETWTFQGTLRENLVYNRTGVGEERLDEICGAVGLTSLVRRLPQGYDTLLDDTVSLSAGQRQLITIARAMVHDAPLLILDEATSSVDTRTELQVQSAMDALMRGRTSFVIAHRLSTIRNADLILVLRGGDVAESGTHEELLALGGVYAELYNSQFERA